MGDALKQFYQPLEDILDKFPSEEEVEKLVNDLENKTTKIHSTVETYLKRLETVEKTVEEECLKNNDRLAELNQALKKYHTRSKQLQLRYSNLHKETENTSALRDQQSEMDRALGVKVEKLVLRERFLNAKQ